MKTLAYCAGGVFLVYWLPFIYLQIFDPQDEGRGGMIMCWFFPIALAAFVISVPEAIKAMRACQENATIMSTLALVLFGVTISPLAVFLFGTLRRP